MASFEDEPVGENEIDLDRIVMDAEYRRQVLMRLRRQRALTEPARRVDAPEIAALGRDD